MKGKCNLTVGNFFQWVNEKFLSNETLELGFHRRIAIETARKWMHEMGFQVLTAQKVPLSMAMSARMLLNVKVSS